MSKGACIHYPGLAAVTQRSRCDSPAFVAGTAQGFSASKKKAHLRVCGDGLMYVSLGRWSAGGPLLRGRPPPAVVDQSVHGFEYYEVRP